MVAYLLNSNYYTRTFVGETSEKSNAPEREGDIFIDLKTDKKYVGHNGSWYEVSCI